jgi:hypothetical protein
MIVATGVFAAMHEFVPGTFETCRRAPKTSAYRGRPEVAGRPSTDAIDLNGHSAAFAAFKGSGIATLFPCGARYWPVSTLSGLI